MSVSRIELTDEELAKIITQAYEQGWEDARYWPDQHHPSCDIQRYGGTQTPADPAGRRRPPSDEADSVRTRPSLTRTQILRVLRKIPEMQPGLTAVERQAIGQAVELVEFAADNGYKIYREAALEVERLRSANTILRARIRALKDGGSV